MASFVASALGAWPVQNSFLSPMVGTRESHSHMLSRYLVLIQQLFPTPKHTDRGLPKVTLQKCPPSVPY